MAFFKYAYYTWGFFWRRTRSANIWMTCLALADPFRQTSSTWTNNSWVNSWVKKFSNSLNPANFLYRFRTSTIATAFNCFMFFSQNWSTKLNPFECLRFLAVWSCKVKDFIEIDLNTVATVVLLMIFLSPSYNIFTTSSIVFILLRWALRDWSFSSMLWN